MVLLYLLVFIVSASWSDFVNYILFQVGPVNVYPIDLLVFSLMLFMVRHERLSMLLNYRSLLASYLLFVLWITSSVVRVIPVYSFSAFGDSRIILPMFFMAVPFLLAVESNSAERVRRQFETILLVSSVAVLLMFTVELVVGHRVGLFFGESHELGYGELIDARGVRILSTEQTFSAAIFIVFALLSSLGTRKLSVWFKLVGLASIPVVLMTQNRTSIASVFFALVFYSLFVADRAQRTKAITYTIVVVAIGLAALSIFAPHILESGAALVKAGLDPEEDPTGTWGWRLLLASESLNTFSEAPLFGHGFGGHWEIFTGGGFVTAPPHNQYLTLMVKTGLVGLLLLIAVIVSFMKSFFKQRESVPPLARPLFDTLFIIVLASIPYGFAYDYVPFYGLYIGMFYGLLVTHTQRPAKNPQAIDPLKHVATGPANE